MSEHEVRDYEVQVQWRDAEGDIVLYGRISGSSALDVQQRLAAAFQMPPIVFMCGASVGFSGITVNVGGVGPSDSG